MYREVAHLNALDRYCELMGVKDASELSSNYVNEDSEEEEIVIQAKACTIGSEYKKEDEITEHIPIASSALSSSLLSSSHPSNILDMSDNYTGLTRQEWRECVLYENALQSSI